MKLPFSNRRLFAKLEWRRARAAAAWILTAFPMLHEAAGHPVHQASAEAHYQNAGKTLEVSVALYADDLEAALTQRSGRPVRLENTPAGEVDPLVFSLLKESFLLTNPAGDPVPLKWVGREWEKSAPLPSPAAGPTAAADRAVVPSAAANNGAPTGNAAPVAEPRVIVFFECELPDGLEGHRVKFSTFSGLFPDQKNLVQFHDGPRRAALAFTPSSAAKLIVLSTPAPAAPAPAPAPAPAAPAPAQPAAPAPDGRQRGN